MHKRIVTLLSIMALLLVWVAFPVSAQDGDTCVVTSIEGAVTRSGPGTDFEPRPPLPAGASGTAVDVQTGLEGFRWWQLETGSWVREDLVTESEGCASIGMTEMADVDADTCVVTSIEGAVTRRAPNTTAERGAPLAAGESAVATDSTPDAGGQTWWQLENGLWVREDLVTETEGCDDLTTVTSPDDVPEDVCVVTSIAGAVTRRGPGTSFERGAPLAADTSVVAVDREPDADGQLWWELENGLWVREDLVFESDGCENPGGTLTDEDIENLEDDACIVTSIAGAVTRRGPGTNFERGAALPEGESIAVTDVEADAGGQNWYRLTTGVWVREDLVDETGNCTREALFLADLDETVCYAVSIEGSVTRTGPGTNFESRAPLPAGEADEIVGSDLDANGQRWWELDSGVWVREDLVFETAACETE